MDITLSIHSGLTSSIGFGPSRCCPISYLERGTVLESIVAPGLADDVWTLLAGRGAHACFLAHVVHALDSGLKQTTSK